MKKRILAGLLALGTVVTAIGASATSTIDVSTIRLEYRATDDVGEGEGVGFSHRYTDIMPGSGNTVDARASILDIVNLESAANKSASAPTADLKIDKLDDYTSSTDRNKDIELELDVFNGPAANDSGHATFRIEFVESGSLVPVVLSNISVYVNDIDSSQFLQVSGISSYRLSSTTKLTAKTHSDDASIPVGSWRFVSPSVNTSSTDPDHWAEITITEASYLDFTLGANESGSASFAIIFKKTDWSGASAVDVTPPTPSYTVSYDGNGSTGGSAPASQTSSSFVTVSGNTGPLDRPGYEFTGWNSAPDGTGLVVGPAEQFRPTSNITLYAQWRAVATTTTVTPATTVAPTSTVPPTTTDGKDDGGEESGVGSAQESLPSTGFTRNLLVVLAVAAILVGFRLRRRVPERGW